MKNFTQTATQDQNITRHPGTPSEAALKNKPCWCTLSIPTISLLIKQEISQSYGSRTLQEPPFMFETNMRISDQRVMVVGAIWFEYFRNCSWFHTQQWKKKKHPVTSSDSSAEQKWVVEMSAFYIHTEQKSIPERITPQIWTTAAEVLFQSAEIVNLTLP